MNIQNLDILTFRVSPTTNDIIFPKDRSFYNKGIKHLIFFDSCFDCNGNYSTVTDTQLNNIYIDLFDKNKNSIVKRTAAIQFYYQNEQIIDLSSTDIDLSISRIRIEAGTFSNDNYIMCGVVYENYVSINTTAQKIASFEIPRLITGEYPLSDIVGSFFSDKLISNIIIATPVNVDSDEWGNLIPISISIRDNDNIRVLDNIPAKFFSFNQYLRGFKLDELSLDPYQSKIRLYSDIYNPFQLIIMYND